ncbi:prepilin peptidase [Frigoribacterium sp. VKM Ac-2836]|uniref:prepilin peptidase n=1 Tax=Frigoribacterium sp. VKM Ac-2836 TaxID=2739014 RepID=UPI0015638AA4|nr:prepilin peptidase [Frigoribacterium sp. VKM Ac-2836]NRD27082.1 prepilin peptidase [Frigoribacterium sp. VKM Ac-2836]
MPHASLLAGAGTGVTTLLGCLGVAVVTPALVRIDIAERRLPNVLVAVAAGAWGVSTALLAVGGDPAAAATSLLSGVSVAVVGLVAALAGDLGMGDVKLGAVLSGVVSPIGPMAFLVFWGLAGALAVGVAGAGSIRSRRGQSPPPSDPPPTGPPRSDRRPIVRDVPFGPCLLAAFWWVVASHLVDAGFEAVLMAP